MPSLSPTDFALVMAGRPTGAPTPAPAHMPDHELKLGRFTDAWQFAQTFFPEIEPYRWQMETLMQLSGYPDPYNMEMRVQYTKEMPLLYTLCAANGSGKDQIVLSAWALFCICTQRRFHWIGTSSSFAQLDQQTWRHIKERAEAINRVCGRDFLEIKKHRVICPDTGAEITLYRTDETGKTEGWHPLAENAPMALVLNECKSLEEDIVMSFKRCHGYTHWLNISSPGLVQRGYFFKRQLRPDYEWPAPVVPGREYFRRVDWRDCPHLASEYARDVKEFGEDSAYILSSYKAIYPSSTEDLFVVPPSALHYPTPAPMPAPRRAGIDMSGGGDATVIQIWDGNALERFIEFREAHTPAMARRVVAYLREHNVPPMYCLGDAGHLGQAAIGIMTDAGFQISGLYNNSKARNAKVYLNRGAELAFNLRHLIQHKCLNLSKAPPILLRQLGERLYELTDAGKIKLEDKAKHRARYGSSPDHFDAAVLANSFVCYSMFTKAESKPEPAPQNVATLYDLWNQVYGNLDKHTAAAGAYRTTGVYSGRQIGHPLPGAYRRIRKTR